MKKTTAAFLAAIFCLLTASVWAKEGTRHIAGKDVSLYFMNDKVFGTVEDHPVWAIYHCGSDLKGEMDINGAYQPFGFQYAPKGTQEGASCGNKEITGTFGPLEMSLGKIERNEVGFVYHVFIGGREHTFSIRYEKMEHGHMVNSIIEGALDGGEPIILKTEGHLCPFATTGIILIVAGALSL